MRSSNPVLTRLTPETQTGYAPAPSGYSQTPSYPSPVIAAGSDRMTIDDVVVRTVGLLGLTALAGALTWIMPTGLMAPMLVAGALIGLVLALIISIKRSTNPALIMAYAIAEGVFVGGVSKFYNDRWPGIVLQAVVGTFGIFFVMSALYKFRIIRSSPKFARGLIGAMIGVLVISLISLVFNTGLRSGGTFGIVFSLVVIVIAALTFILDFDLIEQSVAQGAPRAVAWICAFGLLVGLIWVYLEVLRLLSYLRGRD